jgi:hypothetical protein
MPVDSDSKMVLRHVAGLLGYDVLVQEVDPTVVFCVSLGPVRQFANAF